MVSEDFEIAFGVAEVDGEAGEETFLAQQPHADVLQGIAETGIEREGERLLIRVDIGTVHGEDGGMNFFEVGHLCFIL